jgi:hypothetical protein
MARKLSTAALPKKNGGTDTKNKGAKFHTIRQIRLLFLSGGSYTARQINALANCNDARKCISNLRAGGMNIKSIWLDKPRCKLYWHELDDRATLPEKP